MASGIIVEGVTDDKIMAHGSLHGFLEYCATEAVKRATKRAVLPLPDPADRLARMRYNFMTHVRGVGSSLIVDPAPLP